MLSLVWQTQKQPKYRLIFIGFWVFMVGLYAFLDYLYFGNFTLMLERLGLPLVLLHQAFNIAIGFVVAVMLSFSQIQLTLNKTEPAGGNAIPAFSFVFGLLTFGCAPCVITFLSVFGIAFTPLVLPFGNLLWKVLLLVLMIVGAAWVLRRIQNTTCAIPLKNR